jgi:molybdopterin-synthase adenylyltransferase
MADDDVLIIDDADRYGRFRLISWWRQEKLQAAKVLVVGAGALGNEVLKNLALLGVGHVFIIDYDTIESTNLTRSVLYRAGDAGKPKCERAAAAVKSLNPDVKVRAVNGNVITDLGLGVFAEMDVVIGCLDNREARLWINRQCWKVGRPWVDGAIQEISGVAKVFVPPDSACYECAMTERDYQLINLKYSCPLLKREDIAEGKVPTAPTISSIIAGLQTQEALKLIHGMAVKPGAAMVFNGESNNFYTTNYQRKEGCLSHETYGTPVDVGVGVSDPVEKLLEAVGGVRLHLDRDLLVDLSCPACGVVREVLKPLALVTLKDGKCPQCSGVMRTTIVHTVERGAPLARRTLRAAGVAPFDVVKVETRDSGVYARLAKDREEILAWV